MIEITKEQAVDYLDRITEAKKMLDAPLCADPDSEVYYLYKDAKRVLVVGTEKLAKVLNHPYRLSSFSKESDKLSFMWNGIEIYDLHCGNKKRIAHIERG